MQIDIIAKKVLQPISCAKCAQQITENHLDVRDDRIVMICPKCHSSIMEFQIDCFDCE